MIKKVLIASALLGLSTAAVAAPSEGDLEIVFSSAGGSFKLVDGETVMNVTGRVGYFLDMHHEVGGAATLWFNTANDPSERLDLGAFYRYNLVESADVDRWWYAGVELDFTNVTEEFAEPMLLRPHAGQKIMLSDDVAFDWNVGYQLDMSDAEQEDELGAEFGLSIFF